MAKIGLKYPVAAPLKADGKTYDTGFVIARAIKASVTANNNDVKLYADDGIAESDTASVNDISPFLGVGFYGEVIRDSKPSYMAKWLRKVKFAEPNDETDTRGETVAFQTPTIEGTVFQSDDGVWKEQAEFATEEEAVAWLNQKANIAAEAE